MGAGQSNKTKQNNLLLKVPVNTSGDRFFLYRLKNNTNAIKTQLATVKE